MTLMAVVTTEEFGALDDALKSHYIEDGDNHTLDVTSVGGVELSDTKQLRNALQMEKKETTKAKKALEEFADLDYDIETGREAITKLAEIADLGGDDALKAAREQMEKQLGDRYTGMEGKLVKKHTGEMETITGKYNSTLDQLKHLLVDAQLTKAITEEKGSVDLLIHAIKQHVKVFENEDGTFSARVVDEDGTDRLSMKSSKDPHALMGISELVQEFKSSEKFARAFDGSGAKGSGATGTDTKIHGNTLTISANDAKDTAKYRAAKAEAEKGNRDFAIAES